MKTLLKKVLPGFLIRPMSKTKSSFTFYYKKSRLNHYLMVRKWNKEGRPVPPPHEIKQEVITKFKKEYGYSVFVETGTFLGDMVDAQRKFFSKIISIELSRDLQAKAKSRFSGFKHISILEGDSGKLLPKIMNDIGSNAIFWLDGHYSEGITVKGDKNCPIYEELNSILANKQFTHVILIDDARCFIGENDYPTISDLRKHIHYLDDRYNFDVKDDIIRATIPVTYKSN